LLDLAVTLNREPFTKKRLRDCALWSGGRLPKSRGVKKAVGDYLRLRALGLMVADGLRVVAKNK